MPDIHSFTVEGPVQVEIIVLFCDPDGLFLTGPCAAEPWYVEVAQGADPTEVTTRLVQTNLGKPTLVHSTSWRQARGGVVLTFVAVMDATTVAGLARVPVQRAELVRGEPTAAPIEVPTGPVIEHGLRHLAWLITDDPVVARELSADWHAALACYVPEPFRALAADVQERSR